MLGVGGAVGCEAILLPPIVGEGNGVPAFRRSGRGRRVSKAALKHNANHVYATREAAAADLAHLGDRSKVVEITMNRDLFVRFFADGKMSADLRHNL